MQENLLIVKVVSSSELEKTFASLAYHLKDQGIVHGSPWVQLFPLPLLLQQLDQLLLAMLHRTSQLFTLNQLPNQLVFQHPQLTLFTMALLVSMAMSAS